MVKEIEVLRESSWEKELIYFSLKSRAPLAAAHALLGPARDSLKRGDQHEDADMRWIDSLDDLISRMLSMTGQVVALAESRELNCGSFTRVNLHDVLHAVVKEACPLAKERKNVISLSIALIDRLYVSGNTASLHRAFSNLVSNAIRYSDPCSEIILSCNHRDTFLEVSIVNQAPERSIGNLLERVVAMRSGWQMERRLQSGGLGLEIVDTIVEQHGGYVTAKRWGKWTVAVIAGLVCSREEAGKGN